LFLGLVRTSRGSTVDFFGPKVYVKYSIGAPGEEFKIGFNITRSEKAVDNVLLYYSVVSLDDPKPISLSEYFHVHMILEDGNVHKGFWAYQFPGQENSTKVYFFVSVLDQNEEEMHSEASPAYASQYNIYLKNPRFNILSFHIDSVNEKALTANITFQTQLITPYDTEKVTIIVDDQKEQRDLLVTELIGRYELYGTFNLAGLHLWGKPTAIPFDSYFLNLTFSVFFKCKPISQIEQISIKDYNDRSIWGHKYNIDLEEKEFHTEIQINNFLQRKIESVYFFIIPTVTCFVLLGGSILLSSSKHIQSRLTIYLTIFVFLLGSFSVNEIIRDMIPTIAYGITTAELILTWLAAYAGIYGFFSLLGHFSGEFEIKRVKLRVLLDFLAFITVAYIFLNVIVVRIESPYVSEISTLFEHISNHEFRIGVLLALSYGIIFQFGKCVHSVLLKFRTKTHITPLDRWISMKFRILFYFIVFVIGLSGGFYIALYLQNQIALLAGMAILFAFLTWLGSGTDLIVIVREWYKETYTKPRLRINYSPQDNPHLYTPEIEMVSASGERLAVMRRFLKVGIENEGSLVAKRCKATLQVIRSDENVRGPSTEPKNLRWENGGIYQDIGINRSEYLHVVLSDTRLGNAIPATENIFALVSTPDTVNMHPFNMIRAQDGFGVGDTDFDLIITSESGELVRATFRVHVTDNWQELNMEIIPNE